KTNSAATRKAGLHRAIFHSPLSARSYLNELAFANLKSGIRTADSFLGTGAVEAALRLVCCYAL
ncbi:MAG: hypothetical protein WBF09_03990, partial [Candidatus Acidiferrum sp.]